MNEMVPEMINRLKDKILFLGLFAAFLFFYTLQIPWWTSNADVLIYACRSNQPAPILQYAFLDAKSLLGLQPQANYHLGHTLVMWAAYHIAPSGLAHTIWPAGLVSALAGALAVALTLLIALKLNFSKKQSLLIAVFSGFIPSIWYHSLIGEVYALQLASILLFIFFFLHNRLIAATLAFLFANLVSPLSGLAFSFVLLAGISKKNIVRSAVIGAAALGLYLLIFRLIHSDITTAFRPLELDRPDRAILYRVIMLAAFIVLNLQFFLYYLYRGSRTLWANARPVAVVLVLGVLPQLLLLFASSTLFVELGSFQLPIFWALAFPVGVALAEVKKQRYLILSVASLLVLAIGLWFLPAQQQGLARHRAGDWLARHTAPQTKMIGDWGAAVGVALARFDWNFDDISNKYFDRPFPTDQDLLATNEDSLIIIHSKKSDFRRMVARLPIPGVAIEPYDPYSAIQSGSVKKLYENDALTLYLWKSTAAKTDRSETIDSNEHGSSK